MVLKTLQIGVIGGADDKHGIQLYEKGILAAYEIGASIARKGATLITGATTGMPYAAVLGASDNGGEIIGISPARNRLEHLETYEKPLDCFNAVVFTGMGLAGREIFNVISCDGIIAIGGGSGTMTEVGIASQEEITIGALSGVGGFSNTLDKINKLITMRGSKLIISDSPKELVDIMFSYLEINGKLKLSKVKSDYGKDVRKILKTIRSAGSA